MASSAKSQVKLSTKLHDYGELVMFTNTLFSVAFGLVGMLLAAHGLPSLAVTFWICVALLSGRTAANAFNRVADRDIDAKDPRTATRQIPAGRLRTREVMVLVIVNFVILAVAAAFLGRICLCLLPIAIVLFIIYSYSKRFTWLCHIILGVACAVAPAGAWIAVTGGLNVTGLVLSAADVFWVAGFDIIYATQDRAFDESLGLHSIPVRFGNRAALRIAAVFHVLAWLLLLLLFFITELSWIYLAGVIVIGCCLCYEQVLVSPNAFSKVNFASYNVNKIISVVLLIVVILDMLIL